MQYRPLHRHSGWFVGIGICCYLLVSTLTGMTHHHSSNAPHDDNCAACFFSANSIAVALSVASLAPPQISIPISPILPSIFLPVSIVNDVLGRAPPASSI